MNPNAITAKQYQSNQGKIIRLLTRNGFKKSTRTGYAGSTTVSAYSTGYSIGRSWNNSYIRTDSKDEAKAIAKALTAAGYEVRVELNRNFNEVLVLA